MSYGNDSTAAILLVGFNNHRRGALRGAEPPAEGDGGKAAGFGAKGDTSPSMAV